MAIEKISTTTNLKEWMNTINELIDSDAGKLDSSGNAVSASKLLTARTINGTSFNGTANITTANWGTARNITISDDDGTNSGDAVSVNGSANVILKLPATIKATLSGNATTATTATKANQLTTARTIAIGGAVTGTATSFNGTANITIDTTRVNLEDAGMSGELPITHGGTGRTDGKAVGLVTKRTIDGISFDGTANVSHFGTCSTAAATAAKVVSCSNFTLTTGSRIIVQFTVTNTAASPTLNVNNTGAKAITYRNSAISAGYLAANRVYEFVYDGTNYELVGDIVTDTNSDTKVTQTVTTTNAEYPILASVDAKKTATSTTTTRFDSSITLNPGTNTITASTFKGALSGNATTATTATKANQLTTARTIWGQSFNGTANVSGTMTNVSVIEFTSPLTGNGGIIDFHFNGSTADYTSRIIEVSSGTITIDGKLTADTVYNAVWNDYAEFFPRGEETEPGDIIALDISSDEEKYVKATKDSILIVGSHSNTFGHLIGGENPPDGQDFVEYNLPKFIPVGLAGRVNVKFKGKSKKGYPVTISDVPGVAELCDFKESKIIGYVVEDTNPDSENVRLVKIFIRK